MIRIAMISAKSSSTGYSAAYLTFSRELRSPLDARYDLRTTFQSENFIPQLIPHLLKLADTLKLAKEADEKMQDKNKVYADQKRRPQIKFSVGDRVLVSTYILRNDSKKISSKLATQQTTGTKYK